MLPQPRPNRSRGTSRKVSTAKRHRAAYGATTEAVGVYPPTGTLKQLVKLPSRLGDTNDRDIEVVVFDQRPQRREDPLVGEIAGGPEKYKCVRSTLGHISHLLAERSLLSLPNLIANKILHGGGENRSPIPMVDLSH